MSSYNTYIRLQPFVAEFLKYSLGDPIVFPPQSIENSTIRVFLQPLPKGKQPDLPAPGLTAVAIPDSKAKPVETNNYLSPRGKNALIECCNLLFNRCLRAELEDMSKIGCRTMTAIYAWCEKHGIDIEYADTVRQRYFRMRDDYKHKGIDLMKRSRSKDQVF